MRLRALIRKESLQIMRDPSAILIAFVLPLVLLFIFGYGINLDSNRVKVGLVLENPTPDVVSLASAFQGSHYFNATLAPDRRDLVSQMHAQGLRGIITLGSTFEHDMNNTAFQPTVQVISDGANPIVANVVQNYSLGAVSLWGGIRQHENGNFGPTQGISIEPRYWYNPELKSRFFLVPGSIAIIMTLIGTLLTALVVAREWERGTMEAMMATPVNIVQILLGKLVPYFVLGLLSLLLCWGVATLWYHVPFRGDFMTLLMASCVFLVAALGQGLLISTVTKDQFIASQVALITAFLPAFMLSGFIFEISAMPGWIQVLTHIFAARYFVTALQALFMTGNVWPLILSSMLYMGIIGLFFFMVTAKKTKKRLD